VGRSGRSAESRGVGKAGENDWLLGAPGDGVATPAEAIAPRPDLFRCRWFGLQKLKEYRI
jgi:hypothetical protein